MVSPFWWKPLLTNTISSLHQITFHLIYLEIVWIIVLCKQFTCGDIAFRTIKLILLFTIGLCVAIHADIRILRVKYTLYTVFLNFLLGCNPLFAICKRLTIILVWKIWSIASWFLEWINFVAGMKITKVFKIIILWKWIFLTSF